MNITRARYLPYSAIRGSLGRTDVTTPPYGVHTIIHLRPRVTDIMANWQITEAPDSYPWPWSPRSQLETLEQVRNAFFSPECLEGVIQVWLRESKSQYESAWAGLSVLWPFGTAEGVLSALDGLPETGRRFYVQAGNDIWLSRLRWLV